MEKDLKDLLLKDLCARLPYGVKCEVVKRSLDGEMLFIRNGQAALNLTIDNVKELVMNNLYKIKPYLFPLSSMNEGQKSFFENKHIEADDYLGIIAPFSLVDCEEWDEVFCWLNKNHFDYRGLIPIGLAIDATNLNIY